MNWRKVRATQRQIEFSTRMSRRHPRRPIQLWLPFPTSTYLVGVN